MSLIALQLVLNIPIQDFSESIRAQTFEQVVPDLKEACLARDRAPHGQHGVGLFNLVGSSECRKYTPHKLRIEAVDAPGLFLLLRVLVWWAGMSLGPGSVGGRCLR